MAEKFLRVCLDISDSRQMVTDFRFNNEIGDLRKWINEHKSDKKLDFAVDTYERRIEMLNLLDRLYKIPSNKMIDTVCFDIVDTEFNKLSDEEKKFFKSIKDSEREY